MKLLTLADAVNPALGAFQAGQQRAQDVRKQQTLAEIGLGLQQGQNPNDLAGVAIAGGAPQAGFRLADLAFKNEAMQLRREAAERAAQPQPTALMQNYEAARQGGFNGSLFDYQTALKRAGATNVSNVTNVAGAKGETEFQKTIGKESAKMFGKLADDGLNAQNELVSINQLPELLQKTGGGLGTAVKGVAANFGIDVGDGTSELQLATQIIDKLTPAQRVPGSGATSDFEAKLFKSALPSLWRSPEANQVIVATMQSLANAKVARGRVAQAVMTGGLSRKQAIAELRKVPDPWAGFRAWRKANGINKAVDVKRVNGAGNSQPSATPRIRIDLDGNEIQ